MKTIVTLLAVMLIAVGAGYLYSRYDQHMSEVAADSLHWPSVTGLVTRSNLEARKKKVGRQSTTDFRVEIDYEYIVDGERFENDIVQFNQDNLSTKEKELLVSTHPAGRQVTVFYNPGKPQQSVLVQGSWP
jgi:hypothetical protein